MLTVFSQSVALCSVCDRSVSDSPASTWGDPDRREDPQWLEQWTPHPDHPEKDQWHHSQKQRDLSNQPSGETTQQKSVLLWLVCSDVAPFCPQSMRHTVHDIWKRFQIVQITWFLGPNSKMLTWMLKSTVFNQSLQWCFGDTYDNSWWLVNAILNHVTLF